MTETKIICWDMSLTLGYFSGLAYKFDGKEIPDRYKNPVQGLKSGIRDLLEKLSGEGFLHFVTTSAITKYSEFILEKTGIRHHFQDVLGRDMIESDYHGKAYVSIADRFGYNLQKAKANMISIGNEFVDRSLDIEGMVLIQQDDCAYYDSQVIDLILKILLEKGKGDFNKGFEALYKKAKVHSRKKRDECRKIFQLEDGIKLEMCIFEENFGVASPIISLKAEQYRKELEPILHLF